MDAGFRTEFDRISHVHLMESVLHLAPYRPGRSPALPFILRRSAKLSKKVLSRGNYVDNINYKRLSGHFFRLLEHYPTSGPATPPLLLTNILSAE